MYDAKCLFLLLKASHFCIKIPSQNHVFQEPFLDILC
jgi:hypothetical protein